MGCTCLEVRNHQIRDTLSCGAVTMSIEGLVYAEFVMELRAVAAANSSALPLHEVRVAPESLRRLGVRCFDPRLLLHGVIPCHASVEPQLASDAIVVPPWMLAHLRLAPGERLRLAVSGIETAYTENCQDACCVTFARKTSVAGPDDWDTAASDSEVDLDSGDESGEDYDTGDGSLSADPLSNSVTSVAAVRRQLRGFGLFDGAVCAVQGVGGSAVLQVVGVEAGEGGPREGAAVVLGASTEVRWQAARAAGGAVARQVGGEMHGDALLQQLLRHVLRPGARREQLPAMAIHPGHALVHGPPRNGKQRALRRLCRAYVSMTGLRPLRVSCAALLAAVDGGRDRGALEPLLEAKVAEAQRRGGGGVPSLLIVADLELLTSEDTTAAPTSSAATVASLLASRLRTAAAHPHATAPTAAPAAGFVAVGTVSDPRRLPPILRSHGCFELNFSLPPPTAQEREALIRALPTLPALVAAAADATDADATDAAVRSLANATGGYTAGDLCEVAALATARAAARSATQRHVAPTGVIAAAADIQWATRAVQPSARGEFQSLLPSVAPEHVGGFGKLRSRLAAIVSLPTSPDEPLHRLGVEPPSGALLYGPPGNGKTLLVQSLAARCGRAVLSASGSQLQGMYVGETEAKIRSLFRQAREAAPSILFLDELDALGASRQGAGGEGGAGDVGERALSTLLNEMDGVGHQSYGSTAGGRGGVFLIGCSSRPEMVDAALLRPGRLEQWLYVPPPDEHDRLEVLSVHTAPLPLSPCASSALPALAASTERYSCAALAAVCREAALAALARCPPSCGPKTEQGSEREHDAAAAAGVQLTALDLQRAADRVKSTQVLPPPAHEALLARYRAFAL